MAWTRHGYHINGTTLKKETKPAFVARCGGPALCKVCREDVQNCEELNQNSKES